MTDSQNNLFMQLYAGVVAARETAIKLGVNVPYEEEGKTLATEHLGRLAKGLGLTLKGAFLLGVHPGDDDYIRDVINGIAP